MAKDVSGAFRPGVLTALVGVSGAGKTTLMDVLAGRKTAGKIEGDIRVQVRKGSHTARCDGMQTTLASVHSKLMSNFEHLRCRAQGFPKDQNSFARISGYVEQNDIHSPQTTVREALLYSARLRLSRDVGKQQLTEFVDQVYDQKVLGHMPVMCLWSYKPDCMT